MKKLLHTLHEHFIPSEHNAYQPHFLRFRAVAFILGVVLILEAFYLALSFIMIPKSDYLAAIFATVLVDQTNEERTKESLNGLSVSERLVAVAQMKADDMATKGYFAHNSPDGKTPWYWFKEAGYDYAAAGENLAVNFTDSQDVTSAWMHSKSHRANIMNGNYTEMGIATAKGIYKGKEAIFVVQSFGRPALSRPVEKVLNALPSTPPVMGTSVETPVVSASSVKPKPPTQKLVQVAVPERGGFASASPISLTPTSTVVAGARTTKLDTEVAPITSPVLETSRVNGFTQLLASPRQTTTMIYLILASLLAFALGLAVFIKIRIQYPHIIANGVLLIAIIISLVLLNSALGFTQGVI